MHAASTPPPAVAFAVPFAVALSVAFAVDALGSTGGGGRDGVGNALSAATHCALATVARLTHAPAAGGAASGASAYVCDAGNHAVRRLERRLPTRLRVSVSATDVSRFDGSAEEPDINMFPLGASAYARRDEVVTLTWAERDGPAVSPPPASQHGFGSQLIEMSAVRQLGGSVTRDWRPAGLVVEVTVPVPAFSRVAAT